MGDEEIIEILESDDGSMQPITLRRLFRGGLNTLEIAELFEVPEHDIYNRIDTWKESRNGGLCK